MLISHSILNRFCFYFGLYISGPILTKYMIPIQISTNPITSNIQISATKNVYNSSNSLPNLVKFWILHLLTNLNKSYDTTPNLNHFNFSKTFNSTPHYIYISVAKT